MTFIYSYCSEYKLLILAGGGGGGGGCPCLSRDISFDHNSGSYYVIGGERRK